MCVCVWSNKEWNLKLSSSLKKMCSSLVRGISPAQGKTSPFISKLPGERILKIALKFNIEAARGGWVELWIWCFPWKLASEWKLMQKRKKKQTVLINLNGVHFFLSWPSCYEFMAKAFSSPFILNLLLRVRGEEIKLCRRFYAKIYFTRFQCA